MEFANADLGDLRLTKRLMRIADAAALKPDESLPARAGSIAQLEGTYRFLENPRVSGEAVLDAHTACTVDRVKSKGTALIVHDTTDFVFKGAEMREGLGWLNGDNGRQGFFGHFSFCISMEGEPLGTLGLHAWVRQGKPKGRPSRRTAQYDPDREHLRWQDSALLTSDLVRDKADVIHVMDREGDSYELFTMLLEYHQRFVVRLTHNRRLTPGRDTTEAKLFDSLSCAPLFMERWVWLSERFPYKRSKQRQCTFPNRAKRLARLQVRAQTIEVFGGSGGMAHVPESLKLQFVEVREAMPPTDEEPVVWRLITTEPIDTEEQVAAIVDIYCRRWLVEEFLKTLKSGCGYEKRQLESSKTLLVDLAIEIAVAWRLLLIRWLTHHKPDVPASHALNPVQLSVLKALSQSKGRTLSDEPAIGEAFLAMAALGGHIPNNGPPGWLVLRRGYATILNAEQTWNAMQATLSEKM